MSGYPGSFENIEDMLMELQNYESQYTYEFNDSGLPVKVIKTSSRSHVMTIEITY